MFMIRLRWQMLLEALSLRASELKIVINSIGKCSRVCNRYKCHIFNGAEKQHKPSENINVRGKIKTQHFVQILLLFYFLTVL